MKLVALRCPECNEALTAENEHIVVTCERCCTAVRIGDEGLSRVPVSYARSKSGSRAMRWQPFAIIVLPLLVTALCGETSPTAI